MDPQAIIEENNLVNLAKQDPEKALTVAFFEGQVAALEQLAKDFRENDINPGDECYGWGSKAAQKIESFLQET